MDPRAASGHIGEQNRAAVARRDRSCNGGARSNQLRRARAGTSLDELSDLDDLVIAESDCRAG